MMRWAVYDLATCPPSFDFIVFLTMAKRAGANGVWFVPGVNEGKSYDYNAQLKRLRSICFPACDLYGMQRQYGKFTGGQVAWPPFFKSTHQRINGYTMGWMKSIDKPEPIMPSADALDRAACLLNGKSIVVTLRECNYNAIRNSSKDWHEWASDHNAYVIRDYEIEPIDFEERLAFYELASLNIGVAGGPMILCWLSHRPFVQLKTLCQSVNVCSTEWLANQGWYPGDQMPWASKKQRLVWSEDDDYDAIESAYQEWKSATQAGSGDITPAVRARQTSVAMQIAA